MADEGVGRLIDATGLRCPWPVLRAARALREGTGTIRVKADDPAAEAELAALAAEHGRAFSTVSVHVYDLAATDA